MTKRKINNYVTYYKDCSKNELVKLFKGSKKFLEDIISVDEQFTVAFKNMSQWILNQGNGKYQMVEVYSGKDVKDASLGIFHLQLDSGFYDCDLEENEVPFEDFIEFIKTYMAVCCDRTSEEIEKEIKDFTIANKYNQTIVMNDNSAKYEFDNGFVTVYGKMANFMVG